MDLHDAIFVAGRQTLLGAALARQLLKRGFTRLVEAAAEPDLCDAAGVDAFFRRHRPKYVFVASGKTGGILANERFPADFMLDNLLSQCHLIDAARRHGTAGLLYLASSCSYPRHCPQPMRVESLMAGPLEPTNEAYATAKLAGIAMCRAYARQHGCRFLSGIPANAFGLEDDFSPEGGHVIPALISRFHRAKAENHPFVEIWGTGTPQREFVFADDLADAAVFVMQHYDDAATPINLGGGCNLTIAQTAAAIAEVVGFEGRLVFDHSRPDGMPLKALDSSRLLGMGWRPKTPFRDALAATYKAYLEQQREARKEQTHVRVAV